MTTRYPNRRVRRARARALRRGPIRPALHALWSSAVALAGLPTGAHADSPIERPRGDYQYSSYSEDDVDDDKVLAGGETSRYDIEMHQLRFQVPINRRWDVAVDLVHETMSGASPQFVVPDAAGDPVQVLSGASIDDTRTDVLFTWNKYYERSRMGLSTGYSTENDYNALNLGVNGETHFNEGNTTLSAGLAISLDDIEPTTPRASASPDSDDKQTYTFNLGFTQVLNRAAAVQSNLTYKHSTGYLSDPYKQVWVVVPGVALSDERPDTRNQLSWLTRFRGHVKELEGTLNADYRLHIDDWGIESHTVDLAWHQRITERLSFIPSFRYYSQSEADFYVPFFPTAPADDTYSSDFRLAAYGALTFGLKAQYAFQTRWTGDREFLFTLAWDRYFSSEDLSFEEDAQEAPGLVDYHVLTLGLGVRW